MNVKFYDGVGYGINHEIADEINNIVIRIMEKEVTHTLNPHSLLICS